MQINLQLEIGSSLESILAHGYLLDRFSLHVIINVDPSQDFLLNNMSSWS